MDEYKKLKTKYNVLKLEVKKLTVENERLKARLTQAEARVTQAECDVESLQQELLEGVRKEEPDKETPVPDDTEGQTGDEQLEEPSDLEERPSESQDV